MEFLSLNNVKAGVCHVYLRWKTASRATCQTPAAATWDDQNRPQALSNVSWGLKSPEMADGEFKLHLLLSFLNYYCRHWKQLILKIKISGNKKPMFGAFLKQASLWCAAPSQEHTTCGFLSSPGCCSGHSEVQGLEGRQVFRIEAAVPAVAPFPSCSQSTSTSCPDADHTEGHRIPLLFHSTSCYVAMFPERLSLHWQYTNGEPSTHSQCSMDKDERTCWLATCCHFGNYRSKKKSQHKLIKTNWTIFLTPTERAMQFWTMGTACCSLLHITKSTYSLLFCSKYPPAILTPFSHHVWETK